MVLAAKCACNAPRGLQSYNTTILESYCVAEGAVEHDEFLQLFPLMCVTLL